MIEQKKTRPSSQKTSARIAAFFRKEIITGNLRPGEKLSSERELGEQFNVSRPTLREAMRLLETESLIKITRGQHGGAKVCTLDPSVTARQVGMLLQLDGTTVADIYEARTFFEPPAARLLATARPAEIIEILQQNIAEAKAAVEAGDPVAFAATLASFSETLTDSLENRTVNLLAKLLRDLIRRQSSDVTLKTYSRQGVDKMHQLSIGAREKLLRLIEAGESDEAESFWRTHLRETAKVSLSAYRANTPIDVLADA